MVSFFWYTVATMNIHDKIFLVRMRWVFYLAMPLVSLILIANLFSIQVVHGSAFREEADNQYVSASYNSFERGDIYFQDKEGGLTTAAGQKRGYKLTIDPSKTTDPEFLYTEITSVVDIEQTRDEFIALASSSRTYAEIVGKLSSEESQLLKKKLGKKVQLWSDKWRVYPLNTVASHVIGLLAYKGDEYGGRYGLEREYESVLVRNNKDLYTNFFARIFHGVQDIVTTGSVLEGDIVTTIEPQVQIYLESMLSDIREKWSSELVGGIIIDPKTGDIYALGATPSFDPNDFSNSSTSFFRNPLVENVYEMGSVIKPLVIAQVWNEGDINESTRYNDTGSVVVGPHTIYNFDKKGRGQVDIQEILSQSLNTGMVHIYKQGTRDDFRSYFQKYGLTEASGIDLPNDVTGITSNLKSNRDIEFANMSFGQGIAMSPMTLTKALTALANNGKTVTPKVVDHIKYPSGLSKKIDVKEGNQVLTEQTTEDISRMLVNAFDSYNNGKAGIPNYAIAAKTGTAQIPAPNGGYYTDRNLHSFFGYFPAYEPRFLVFLYTVHPKNVRYASQTLLEPFRDISQYLINYYNIPPDR